VTINLRRTMVVGTAVLLMMCVCSGPSLGQTSATTPRTFSLEDALSYALQNYPAVRASLEQVNAARAVVSIAHAQYLPSLSGVYEESRATLNQVAGIWLPTAITPTVEGAIAGSSGQNFWGSQAAALFSWEPIDFGLRRSSVQQARSAEDKSNADLALTRLQVTAAVANYFLTVLTTQQAVAAAQANVDRWQVFNQSIHTLVDNTLRPGANASRADAQLALARTQLYQAQQSEQAALAILASLMGAAGSEIRLDAGILLDLPPTDSLSSAAPSANPLAREQKASVQQAQAQEKVLNRTDYPRLFLQAEGFGRGSEVPNNGSIIGNANGLLPGRGDWVAGLTITFPNVFDFKALSAEKQVAKATEKSQQALYEKTIQDLTGQVLVAIAQLKGAQLVAQQTPIELAAARASETQSRARYDASLATLTEVAEAAEENVIGAVGHERLLSHVGGDRAAGRRGRAAGGIQPLDESSFGQ